MSPSGRRRFVRRDRPDRGSTAERNDHASQFDSCAFRQRFTGRPRSRDRGVCARRRRSLRRRRRHFGGGDRFEGREFRAPTEREMRAGGDAPSRGGSPAGRRRAAGRGSPRRRGSPRCGGRPPRRRRPRPRRCRSCARRRRPPRRPARPRQPGARHPPARQHRPLGPQPVLEQPVRRPHLQLQRLPLRLGRRRLLAVRLRRHLLVGVVAQRRHARVLELRSQLHPVGAVLAQRRLSMAAGLRRLCLRQLLPVRPRGASGRLQRRPRRGECGRADAAGDLERGDADVQRLCAGRRLAADGQDRADTETAS